MRSTATEFQSQRASQRSMFRHPLARDIAIVLAAKFLLLLFGFWLLFGPETRPTFTPDGILEHLSAPPPTAPETS